MKKYYFSAAKNAHNIELVMNRAFNLAQDAAERGDRAEYMRLMEIHDDAQEVLSAVLNSMVGPGVSLLDGRMFGRARDLSVRGVMIRDGMNLAHKGGA